MTDKGSGIARQKSRRTLKEKTSGRTEILDLSKRKMPKKSLQGSENRTI